MTALPAPGATASVAAAIDERGRIAGAVTDAAGVTHAALWILR